MINRDTNHHEQSLIAALVADPANACEIFDIVSADDFYSARHKQIVSKIHALFTQNQEVDVITVSEDDSSMLDYLVDLVSNCTTANANSYAKIIYREAVRRRAKNNLQTAESMIEDADDVDDFLSILSKVPSLEVKGSDYVSLNDGIQRSIRALEERFNGTATLGLKTGFQAVDDRIVGYQGGDLIVVAGRPSMGKTTFVQNIVENLINAGGGALFFSFEMTQQQLLDRMICSQAGVPFSRYRTGKLLSEDWVNLEAGVGKIKDKNLIIIDRTDIDIDHACNIAKKIHREHSMDLIVFDYMQLIRCKLAKQSEYEEVKSVSRALKTLAMSLHVPVIAVSQLNRNVEERSNKRPLMADLRGSGQIEQDANFIHFLYRDEYYNEDSEQKGLAEVITAKMRDGEPGPDLVKSELGFSRFKTLDSSYEPPKPKEKYIPYSRSR